jgi:hypothetical protein
VKPSCDRAQLGIEQSFELRARMVELRSCPVDGIDVASCRDFTAAYSMKHFCVHESVLAGRRLVALEGVVQVASSEAQNRLIPDQEPETQHGWDANTFHTSVNRAAWQGAKLASGWRRNGERSRFCVIRRMGKRCGRD